MMSYFSRFRPGPLERLSSSKRIDIRKAETPEGLSFTDDVMLLRRGDELSAYDRVCDHNGGRLISKPASGTALCPFHGWEFNPHSGKYLNVNATKEQLAVMDRGETWEMLIPKSVPVLPQSKKKQSVTIRYLNHACLFVECNGLKFATDPWLFGPAFCNGWWLAEPTPDDAIDRLNDCDFIYVSHNHPDHLHPETLSMVRTDMPFLTANFASRSAELYLHDLGFEQVFPAEFGTSYSDPSHDFAFTVLKSGDFRDDSGLYFTCGEFSGLLTVDANFLNFNALPRPLTFLATSFAGGASGFPLCFDTYDEEEKRRILSRNRNALKAAVKVYMTLTTPAVYMPYAGYFREDPTRDAMVAENNRKNAPDDYATLCRELGVTLANPIAIDTFMFHGNALSSQSNTGKSTTPATPTFDWYYVEAKRRFGEIDLNEVRTYFETSGFKDDLILLVSLTDVEFAPIVSFRVDFRKEVPQFARIYVTPNIHQVRADTGARVEYCRIRKEAFIQVVRELLPWEDIAIGFQARIDRTPNIYNSDFWFHFTNVHIKGRARRAIMNCGGSCRVIEATVF